jgi:hypothetical protein
MLAPHNCNEMIVSLLDNAGAAEEAKGVPREGLYFVRG